MKIKNRSTVSSRLYGNTRQLTTLFQKLMLKRLVIWK